MRDFGKVHTSFWASETLRGLDSDSKLLALYLLTSTHTHQAGAFRLPNAYAAEDLGWDVERLAKGYETLSNAGWLRRCERAAWVWIVNFSKFNRPENPNQQKSVEKQLAAVPENCSFAVEIGRVSEPLPKGSSKGSCNPSSPSPSPSLVSKKKKESKEVTLSAWLDQLEGDAVPADDPIFDWASKQGIPRDWIALAWYAMEDKYQDRDKTYIDWRAAFRTEVRNGWLDVWRHDARAGSYVLTLKGEQLRRESQA